MPNRVSTFSQFAGVAPPWSLPNLDANFTAITQAFNDSSLGYVNFIGTDTGAANNYVVSCPFGAPSAYNPGMMLTFPPANTNIGASTMTVSPLSSVPIVRAGNTALSGGELVAGVMIALIFDGSSFRILTPQAVTGTVAIIAGATAPPAHLLCNGAAYSRTVFAPLFAFCGTAFGAGDGSTTFNIPNMSGRFPVGPGTLAAAGGAANTALAIANLPAHNHVININESPHTHTYNYTQFGAGGAVYQGGAQIIATTPTATTAVSTGISATSNNTGSGTAFSNLPPYLTFNFAIKT